MWLPVVVLPLANIALAVTMHQSFTISMMWSLGAIAEELFFRFFLLKTFLLPRVKPTLAILLVSILFAGMHLFNLRAGQPLDQTLLQCFAAFAFGIWAGAVTWKSTWLKPLLAHVLLNLTAVNGGGWFISAVYALVLVDGVLLLKNEG